jgi:hypothetical protein
MEVEGLPHRVCIAQGTPICDPPWSWPER